MDEQTTQDLALKTEQYKEPSALVLYNATAEDGYEMLQRPLTGLAYSGISAGLSIGFSVVASSVLFAELSHFSWHMLLVAVGATLGYLVVILGRQGLVTESAVAVSLPVLSLKKVGLIKKALAVLGVVTVGNLLGALLFALLLARTDLLELRYLEGLRELAMKTIEPGFSTLFVRGILGGWAIAMAVWTGPSAGPARVATIFMLAYLTGLAHFTHLAAGSIEVLYLAFSGQIPVSQYFISFLPPVMLGNLFGGVVMVALLNHLQVSRDQKKALQRGLSFSLART